MEEESPPERRVSFGRDWTKGSIIGNLWGLSWPIMISQIFMTLGPTVDMVWVGKLGAVSIAGVGISGMVVQLINMARMGAANGHQSHDRPFRGGG